MNYFTHYVQRYKCMMKIFIGIYLCLLTSIEAGQFRIITTRLSAVSDYIAADHETYINNVFIGDTISDRSMFVTYGIGDDNGVYEEVEGYLCNDDTSTPNGTYTKIVRISMGIDMECPIRRGNYTGPNEFRSDGVVGDRSIGTSYSLAVTGHDVIAGSVNYYTPLFTASYQLTPIEE